MSTHGEMRNAVGLLREPDVPGTPRRAEMAGWVATVAGTAGFFPLHLVWTAGIPLFADPQRFAVWHAGGGAACLWALNALMIPPAVLAFALIRPWGTALPRWVTGPAGRQVPRKSLVVGSYVLVAMLGVGTVATIVLVLRQWGTQSAIFSPWAGVYGLPQLAVWLGGLAVATHSAARRTRRSTILHERAAGGAHR